MSEPTLGADQYFAIVPEWVLYHEDLSDRAVRLYGVLSRMADKHGVSWPSRAFLAERLRCSKESIDRAVKQLTGAEALAVERRFDAATKTWQATRYTVHRSSPVTTGSRTGATTPSRADDEGVAASVTTEVEPGELEPSELEESAPSADTASADLEQLCIALADAIEAHGKVGRPTITTAWRRDMRLLVERGELGIEGARGHPPEVVARAIGFTFERLADPGRDGFCWADQVRSPGALRRHWPKLAEAKRKLEQGTGPSNGAQTIDRVANRLLGEQQQQRPALALLPPANDGGA